MASALEISSLSVMVGSPACNLRCPFCISKQTYRVDAPSRCAVPLERIAFLADKFLRVCAGLPYGIPGTGDDIDIAIQHAPQFSLHLISIYGKLIFKNCCL